MEQIQSLNALTCQELRSLIFKDVVKLEQLSDTSLETLFQYELTAVCQNDVEGSFLPKIANLMVDREGNANAIDQLYKEKLQDLGLNISES